MTPRTARRAFSLIEVVAAVAIFAVGMVAILGLFGPVAKSVANVGDAEAAARAADAVRARLRALPFSAALALVQDPAAVRAKDASGAYNPNDGARYPAVIFGRRNGDIGIYEGGETGRRNWIDGNNAVLPNAEKYFEIDLIQNPTLSPPDQNATAAVVAFNIRVRWPAFIAQPGGAAVQFGANPAGGSVTFDHGKKEALFFTGAIRR